MRFHEVEGEETVWRIEAAGAAGAGHVFVGVTDEEDRARGRISPGEARRLAAALCLAAEDAEGRCGYERILRQCDGKAAVRLVGEEGLQVEAYRLEIEVDCGGSSSRRSEFGECCAVEAPPAPVVDWLARALGLAAAAARGGP